jgi:SWI/SNF-related matrix-associated actin-dependent regulator 1 of chromatin subfamily A
MARTKPFPHQVEAIDYIQNREFVALFDEQGLGKTKIVLDALCNNLKDGILDGGLIICRKNLIQNWQDEIETHSFLKSIVLRGTPKEKGNKFLGFTHFYIINYESVFGELERLKLFLAIRKMAIVLDESHAIKNPNAKTSKAVLELSSLAKKRIIVSGTPVANRPADIWSQFYFLDGGNLLGQDFKEFKNRYSVNLIKEDVISHSGVFDDLREIINANSIRRKKNDVLELPEKVFIDKYVDMNGIQQTKYLQLRDQLTLEIENIHGEIVLDESNDLLKKLLRLAQIASNPYLIDKSYNEIPAKFPVLYDLVEEIVNKGEKVIIWSCFVENILKLKKDLKLYGAKAIHGDIPIDLRNAIVKDFKNNPETKVLIANPAAAKEGLTLTVANNAVYLDRNFNLVDYLQSQDRIHRISQTKQCNIYKLIARETIDEYIDEILKRKNYVASLIQGDDVVYDPTNILTKEKILTYIGGTNNEN